jgi:hypothetical protein
MTQPAPQRVIVISIIGTDELSEVYYTYTSPVTGLSYINCPTCDMQADQPTNLLFALDFHSAKNGWTITSTSPRKGSPKLDSFAGALNLSVLVADPYTDMVEHKFYIHYLNVLNETEMERDPQVGNIVRPR